MSATLFSRDWYRIAELKPLLRRHVTVTPHRYRGRRWYLLEDHITGQIRRITPESYLIVGLMNGKRTVDKLWELSSDRLGESMPTHEELLQLLSSLYQANLIRMDLSGDIKELFERGSEATRKRWMGKLKSPLSIQIPLVDPERFLKATQHLVKPFFSPIFLLIWCLLIGNMLILAGQNWDELTKNVADRVLAADNLILLWMIYPVIKLIHELGHGYCVKRGGGEVHELGFMLLVLVPMPYVDASASSAFADKKQRMLVGSAGILIELFIAALAMIFWANAESGLVKSIAYNIMFIAGVSTVLVNGNPLLRFDGYYILADFLEIPNLGQRANQYWGWLSKRVLFGIRGLPSPAYDRREAAWLFGYGFLAFAYRIFLMITIILFVAQQYFFIGVVLAVWSVTGTFIWPNLKIVFKAWQDSDISASRRSPTVIISLCAGLIIILLGILPLPISTSIQGVVQLNENRRVIAKESCFITQVHHVSGALVNEGDLLIECQNRELHKERQVLQQQLMEASAQRLGFWDDPVSINIYQEELERLKSEILESEKRIQGLNLRAGANGIWSVKNAEDLPGIFVKRGTLVGHILSDRDIKVRAMVPEADIKLVRENVTRVQAVKAAALDQVYTPTSWEIFPSTSRQPASEILTEEGGGEIMMNPSARESQSLLPFFPLVMDFDQLPDTRVDERVYIKFEHPPEPIIYRIYRTVRRTFLTYFDV